jgi:hypothetical protein
MFILAYADAAGCRVLGSSRLLDGERTPHGHDADRQGSEAVGYSGFSGLQERGERGGEVEKSFALRADQTVGYPESLSVGEPHDEAPAIREGRSWGGVGSTGIDVGYPSRVGLEGGQVLQPWESKPMGPGCAPWPPGPGQLDEWREYLGLYPSLEPSVRRESHGAPDRLGRIDQLRALGNAVVPQQAALAFTTLLQRALR